MTADLYYETARKLVLKDKREVFVRQLNAGDAEAMLVYLQKTAQETHFLMRLPEEAVYTLENERKILQNTRESKQTFMLGALTQDGSVVGNNNIKYTVNELAGNKYEITYSYSYSSALGTKTVTAKDSFTIKSVATPVPTSTPASAPTAEPVKSEAPTVEPQISSIPPEDTQVP